MTWVALSDRKGVWLHPGLPSARAELPAGTLTVDVAVCDGPRPREIVRVAGTNGPDTRFSLIMIPDFGFVVEHGRCQIPIEWRPERRLERVQVSYFWNARGQGKLCVVDCETGHVVIGAELPTPTLCLGTLRALANSLPPVIAREGGYLAISSRAEPLLCLPGLSTGTSVAGPDGSREIQEVARGDIVLTAEAEPVRVLARVTQTLPATGQMMPVRLSAPLFGIRQDVILAPFQNVLIGGTDVEYAFGRETVLVPARHLVSARLASFVRGARFQTYHQVLLGGPKPIWAGGLGLESLSIGRMRRKPEMLALSSVRDLERRTLPDHGKPATMVLKPHEAHTLAVMRAA